MQKQRRKQRSDAVERLRWTPEEHAKLAALVAGCESPVQWSIIADAMCESGFQRSAKQCRHRWINHASLDTDSREQRIWSSEEKALVAKLHAMCGPAWHKIAKQFQGRTENQIKNLWNSTMRHKVLDKKPDSILTAYVRLIRQGLPPDTKTLDIAKRIMEGVKQSMETEDGESESECMEDQHQSLTVTNSCTQAGTKSSSASKSFKSEMTVAPSNGQQASARSSQSCASTKRSTSCVPRKRAKSSPLYQAVLKNLKVQAHGSSECHSEKLTNKDPGVQCHDTDTEMTTEQALPISYIVKDIEDCHDEHDTASVVDLISDNDNNDGNEDEDDVDDNMEDVVGSNLAGEAAVGPTYNNVAFQESLIECKEAAALEPRLAVVDSSNSGMTVIQEHRPDEVVSGQDHMVGPRRTCLDVVNAEGNNMAASSRLCCSISPGNGTAAENPRRTSDVMQQEVVTAASCALTAPVTSHHASQPTLNSWDSVASSPLTNMPVLLGKSAAAVTTDAELALGRDVDMLTSSISAARQRALTRLQSAVPSERIQQTATPVGVSEEPRVQQRMLATGMKPYGHPQLNLSTNPNTALPSKDIIQIGLSQQPQPSSMQERMPAMTRNPYVHPHVNINPNPHIAMVSVRANQSSNHHTLPTQQVHSATNQAVGADERALTSLYDGVCNVDPTVIPKPVGNPAPNTSMIPTSRNQAAGPQTLRRLQTSDLIDNPKLGGKPGAYTRSPFQGLAPLSLAASKTSQTLHVPRTATVTALQRVSSHTNPSLGGEAAAHIARTSVNTKQLSSTVAINSNQRATSLHAPYHMPGSVQSQCAAAIALAPNHSRQLSCESVASSFNQVLTPSPSLQTVGDFGVDIPSKSQGFLESSREQFMDSLKAVEMVAQAVGLQHQTLTTPLQRAIDPVQGKLHSGSASIQPFQQAVETLIFGEGLCQQRNGLRPTPAIKAVEGQTRLPSNNTAPPTSAPEDDAYLLDFLDDMDCDLFT